MKPISVLALQPYFGGSHSQFHNGWVSSSSLDWTTLTLPPRHWKWRMRHAAIHFANKIHQLADRGESWDVIFATDMMNIAELRGLLRPELRQIPIVLYFHENQFAYPSRLSQERDFHFAFTNFVSAIAADQVWFNSQFNADSLISNLLESKKKWPDFPPIGEIEKLPSKFDIQPPGIEAPPFAVEPFQKAQADRAKAGEPIRIVWAARWEHDKNPQALLDGLRQLRKNGTDFEFSVIGQVFRTVPEVFETIKSEFGDQILRWGYQESRLDYWKSLAEADVFISTANHEFFGLAAAEAIAAGCFPLLPNRLAYPELLTYAFPENEISKHLYDDSAGGFAGVIRKLEEQRSAGNWPVTTSSPERILERLEIVGRAKGLDKAMADFVSGVC